MVCGAKLRNDENYRNCCHLMSDFKAKKAPDSISALALPQTLLGELAALPRPTADPIPAPGLETTCLPKYAFLNPPMRIKQCDCCLLIYIAASRFAD